MSSKHVRRHPSHRRQRPQVLRSVRWLQAGVAAAGLGAAISAGAAAASAETGADGPGPATHQTDTAEPSTSPKTHQDSSEDQPGNPVEDVDKEERDNKKPKATNRENADGPEKGDNDKNAKGEQGDQADQRDQDDNDKKGRHRKGDEGEQDQKHSIISKNTVDEEVSPTARKAPVAVEPSEATVSLQSPAPAKIAVPKDPHPVLTFIGQVLVALHNEFGFMSIKPRTALELDPEDMETGAIVGHLNAYDLSKHQLSYQVISGGKNGVTTVDKNGDFIYTPDHSWAHAGGGTDSVTIKVADYRGWLGVFAPRPHVTVVKVPLTIAATNYAPTLTVTQADGPDPVGAIGYNVATGDADGDPVTQRLNALPTHGAVTVGTTASLVYTPNAAYAHSLGVGGVGSDSFTVRATDDHGGVTDETVTAPIAFHNWAPAASVAPKVTLNTDGSSTVKTSYADADGDVITYTVSTPGKGSVTYGGNGTFTYTPTVAAQIQAGASSADRTDSFAIAAGDGYTLSAAVTIDVEVRPPYWAETRVKAGTGPSDVAFGADGSRAYVANEYEHSVTVIDTSTKAVVASAVQVGNHPTAVVVRPGGDVYVANAQSNTVSAIDPVSNSVVATIPVGTTPAALALSADGTELFVANNNANSLTVINTNANVVSGVPISTGSGPSGLVVSPSSANPKGDTLFVTNYNDNTVSAFDVVGRALRGNVAAGTNPVGVAYSPAAQRLLVADPTDSAVTVIDVQGNSRWTIPVGGAPVDVAVSPLGTYAYVANMGSHKINVISMATNTVISVIDLGGGSPSAVAVSPDGRQVYVTLSDRGEVVILSVPKGFE